MKKIASSWRIYVVGIVMGMEFGAGRIRYESERVKVYRAQMDGEAIMG